MLIENFNVFDEETTKALEMLGKEEYVPSKDTILRIHEAMIENFGGTQGVRDKNLFESTCVAPYQTLFGMDAYQTVFDKAAKYLYDFANYQIFLDGNKRTGLAVCQHYLNMNGYNLNLTAEKHYELVINIATHKVGGVADIAKILRDNSAFARNTKEEQKNDINGYDTNDREY